MVVVSGDTRCCDLGHDVPSNVWVSSSYKGAALPPQKARTTDTAPAPEKYNSAKTRDSEGAG